MNSIDLNFNEALKKYLDNVQQTKLNAGTKELFDGLAALIYITNQEQALQYKEISDQLSAIQEQLNNIQISNKDRTSLDNNINNKIEELNKTLEPAINKINTVKNSITDEEIVELRDGKKWTHKKIADKYGLNENTVRQRYHRTKNKQDTNKKYKEFAKKVLTSNLDNEYIKKNILDMIKISEEDWDDLRDELENKNK